MAYSKTSSSGYSPIDKEQSDDEIETLTLTLAGENGKGTRHLAKTAPFLIVCIICGYILGDQFPIRSLNSHTPQSRGCVGPSIRREWRSSSDCEKQEYISAVQRLRNVPSRSNASQSLFDDFPYVHTLVGAYSHAAAAFSSWHRAFLHTYERALQADCGYSGTLAYWDWTLDWHNLTAAPVWSQTSGFGGDGDRNETNDEPIRGGYCVSHGPFAQLQVLYYGPWYRPHCLSWGFEHGHRLEVDGSRVKPEAIESLMKLNEYEDFNLQLKDGPHLAIPRVVNGDFALFTAPYGRFPELGFRTDLEPDRKKHTLMK